MDTSFEPNKDRILEFDQRMRQRLADSLEYLSGATEPEQLVEPEELTSGIQRILKAPLQPDTFAHYYRTVYAIQDGDMEGAAESFKKALKPTEPKQGIEIIPFNGKDADARSSLYLKFFDSDPERPMGILPIRSEVFEKSSQLISDTFDLMRRADSDLHAECQALLRVILLGEGPTDKTALTFGGASAFELWGSICLNAIDAPDIVDMLTAIAHECCHGMLFGYSIDGDLVLNSEEERFSSPLRIDPRPMDGIYHATYVLARMYHAARVVAESGLLQGPLQSKLVDNMSNYEKSFYDSLSTIRTHAKCTDIGQSLIEGAAAYMDKHCPKE